MSRSARPYAQLSIAQLEQLFGNADGQREVFEGILAELRHRSTHRAGQLRARVQESLTTMAPSARAQTDDAPAFPLISEGQQRAPRAEPAIAALPKAASQNRPQDVLRAWTAIEVLTPNAFRRPADLAGGDNGRVARFDRGVPWEAHPKGRPGTRLYFQIVLGTIKMQPAVDLLLRRFTDRRPDRPEGGGEAPLAIVIVDREGRPIPDACATVSSFGWGLPIVLREKPSALAQWPRRQHEVEQALHKRLFVEDSDGRALPIAFTSIVAAYEWLVSEFCLDPALTNPPSFAVRSFVGFASSTGPEPLLLNSFFLEDLNQAASLFEVGCAPETLRRFLGSIRPEIRQDLLNDVDAIEEAVAPGTFPLGRWPGPGRHPLVLMQQAAVNQAVRQKKGEILAVNGPPGTGKTTMLRDIVSSLVTDRALAMTAFDDPEKTFTSSGRRLKAGNAWIHLYRLDPRLKGFEMLVASSNNKAVENVSRELPGLGAIAADATNLQYFRPLSDNLIGRESWGAIAAVLGNATNRATFKQNFWWHKDTGLFAYLKSVCGVPVEFEEEDGTTRTPELVARLNPPRNHRDALRRWQLAREKFRTLHAQVAAQLNEVETLRRQARFLPDVARTYETCRCHAESRPGFWPRLLQLGRYAHGRASTNHCRSSSRRRPPPPGGPVCFRKDWPGSWEHPRGLDFGLKGVRLGSRQRLRWPCRT